MDPSPYLDEIVNTFNSLPLNVKAEALLGSTNELVKVFLQVFWPGAIIIFILLIVTIFAILASSIAVIALAISWAPKRKPVVHLSPGKTFEVAVSQERRPDALGRH